MNLGFAQLAVMTALCRHGEPLCPAGTEMSAAVTKNGAKSPTCKVCGDESSGFHYGVDSCEGCKGFFRRCITQGMTHKCSNEEKCDITPFTRNSCQYCRLKKCFSVGMSREASRLGRRPKRLKDPNDSKQHSTINQPIAPYPSSSELHKLRMAELQRLLQQNGTFKAELMQAFLSAAKASFKEHQRNPTSPSESGEVKIKKEGKGGEIESGYSSLSSPSSMKSQSPQTDPNQEGAENQYENMAMLSPSSVNAESVDMKNIGNLLIGNQLQQQRGQGGCHQDTQGANGLLQVKAEPGTESQNTCMLSPLDADMVSVVNSAASLHHHHNQQQVPHSSMEHNQGGAAPFLNSIAALQQQDSLSESSVALLLNSLAALQQQNMSRDAAALLLNSLNMMQQQQDDESSTASLMNSLMMLQQHMQQQQQQQEEQQQQQQQHQEQQQQTPMSVSDGLKDDIPSGYSPLHIQQTMDPNSPTASLVNSFAALHQQNSMDNDTQSQMDMFPQSNMSFASNMSMSSTPPMLDSLKCEFHVNIEDFTDEEVEHIFHEASQQVSQHRLKLIDEVAGTVVEAHLETCRPTHQNVKEANERLALKTSKGFMPDMSKLTLDPNKVWQQFLKNMVPEITFAVKFCKKIPGFSEITQDDQIVLIKQGSFEILICRFCNLVDVENEMIFDSDMTIKCPRSVVKSMPMGEFVDEFFSVAGVFNPLNMTDGEIGLFSCLLVICPDRENLKNKKAIQKLQTLLLQCLYLEILKNHPDAESTFRKIIKVIPTFRRINAQHSLALNNININKGTSFPPLHKEVFDVDS